MSAFSRTFRVHRLATRPQIAVVNDDVGNSRPPADLHEQGQVRLATALDDRDLLTVRVVAERMEDERERHLLGHPLDEDHRAREEELGPLGVELTQDAERVLDVDRAQPLDRRHAELVTR